MTDWIDELVKSAKDKHEAQRQEDERFNTEQRLKKKYLDDFWTTLRALVAEWTAEFNGKYGSNAISVDAGQPNRLVVTAKLTSRHLEKKTILTHSAGGPPFRLLLAKGGTHPQESAKIPGKKWFSTGPLLTGVL